MQDVALYGKLDKLHKYQKKEQISMEEMLYILDYDCCEHFPLVFRELGEGMCLSFGREMREVDAPGHTSELGPILGLTYNGILDTEFQIIPKSDILIFILSIIIVMCNGSVSSTSGKTERQEGIRGEGARCYWGSLEIRHRGLGFGKVPGALAGSYK